MATERHFPVIVTGTHYISGLFALYKLMICRVLRFSCLLFYLDHHVCVFAPDEGTSHHDLGLSASGR